MYNFIKLQIFERGIQLVRINLQISAASVWISVTRNTLMVKLSIPEMFFLTTKN